MKYFKILLVGLLVISFMACDTEEVTKSRTELLTQKVWSFDVATGTPDQADFIDAINTDWQGLTIDFKTDGTYTVVQPGETSGGTWELDSSEKNILLDKGTVDEWNWFIMNLSETELYLNTQIDNSNSFGIYFK